MVSFRARACFGFGCGALFFAACRNPLPARGDGPLGSPSSPDAAGAPRLRFDPPASTDAVAPVVRVTLEFPEPLADLRVALVAGVLSASQLHDLAKPAPPASLASRVVPSLAWLDADGSSLVVAPLTSLEPSAVYTIATSAPLVALPVAWLMLIFASYGYKAPRNIIVAGSFVLAALLISGAIYLIMDLEHPFAGVLQVSYAPLERALTEVQR